MIHGRVVIALQHLDTIQVTTRNFVFCLFAVNASGGESVGSDAVLFEFPRVVFFGLVSIGVLTLCKMLSLAHEAVAAK
jgi:hypothetical protein